MRRSSNLCPSSVVANTKTVGGNRSPVTSRLRRICLLLPRLLHFNPAFHENTERVLPCDSIVLAIGETFVLFLKSGDPTLPLLLPLILTVTLLRLIDLLKVYAQIWVLFGNLVNTRVLNIHLYTLGLGTHEYGKASALGVLTLLAVMLFTWLLLPWIQGERVHR